MMLDRSPDPLGGSGDSFLFITPPFWPASPRIADITRPMLRPGHIIALCVFALLTLGVVMVSSADMSVRLVGAGHPATDGVTFQSIVLSRSSAYMVLALTALIAGTYVPVRRLAAAFESGPSTPLPGETRRRVTLLLVASLVLVAICALVYVPFIGLSKNGSHRWIALPFAKALTMQPSEIAKWGLAGLMAWYAASAARTGELARFWKGLVPALVAVAIVAAFVVLEDLGTGALIAVSACVILLAAGARLWQFLIFVPMGLAGVAAAIITNPYRIDRITAFLNPYADPEKTGYHMIQSLLAVSNGDGFGRGLGFGLQKMGYLPEGRTDFIFGVICEELGIAGAGLVVGLFLALVWAGYAIHARERSPLLRLFVLGVVSTVGLQALINLAVATGMAPTKGIALPMLSSGGTGWILTAFSLGLVLAVDRTQDDDEVVLDALVPA